MQINGNNKYKHFKCCYHDANDKASFKQFYENVDMSILWSICRRGENERGATATTTEMVPRQHSGSDNSIEMSVQKKVWRERIEQDGGVFPVTGFPRDDGMATRRNMHATISDTMQTRASHTTHMHSFHGGRSRRLYLWSVRFGAVRVWRGVDGSRRSRNGRRGK